MAEEIRLNKYISDTGFCSRREADQLIADERVSVNGVPARMGMKVLKEDKVRVDGEILKYHSVREELALIKAEKKKLRESLKKTGEKENSRPVSSRQKRGAWKVGIRRGKHEQAQQEEKEKSKNNKEKKVLVRTPKKPS